MYKKNKSVKLSLKHLNDCFYVFKEISNKTKDGGFSRNKQQKLIFETIKRIKNISKVTKDNINLYLNDICYFIFNFFITSYS